MISVLLPLVLCVAVAVGVLGLVAVPARRSGRDVLTARGEEVFVRVRSGTDAAAAKTSDLVSSAAGRVRAAGASGGRDSGSSD